VKVVVAAVEVAVSYCRTARKHGKEKGKEEKRNGCSGNKTIVKVKRNSLVLD
tara:strand:+ start:703 stop:858 length:156 start_codon:yes stop_codon:yes gene_type:complete